MCHCINSQFLFDLPDNTCFIGLISGGTAAGKLPLGSFIHQQWDAPANEKNTLD